MIEPVDLVPSLHVVLFLVPGQMVSLFQSREVVDVIFLDWRLKITTFYLLPSLFIFIFFAQ